MSERGPYTPKPPTVIPKPVFVSRTVSVRQDHHDAIAARADTQERTDEATCSRCSRPYFTEAEGDDGECCICNARLAFLGALARIGGPTDG